MPSMFILRIYVWLKSRVSSIIVHPLMVGNVTSLWGGLWMNSYIKFQQIFFFNSIEVADSLENRVLRELGGSSGNFQRDGKAFIHVALPNLEVAVHRSGNWSSGTGRLHRAGTGRRGETLRRTITYFMASLWPTTASGIVSIFPPWLKHLFSMLHHPSCSATLPTRAETCVPGGRYWGSLTFSTFVEIDRRALFLPFLFSFTNCWQAYFIHTSCSQT